LVGGALSYYSVTLYYIYFYDQNYNVGRVPGVIKEQLEQNRVILTGWLFILGALVVTPMFSIGQILEVLTLPKQQEVWALLWLTGAYAWIGIGLLMLVILRIMETHWLREIQLEASLQSQKRE
jgi:hypothetical protein